MFISTMSVARHWMPPLQQICARMGGVAICGRISQTVAAEPYGIRNLGAIGGKRVTLRNFLVFDYIAIVMARRSCGMARGAHS